MWSNLRDVAGKISSVVAPPLDPEEEEYDEEEEDGDEEEYEEEDEDHSNNNNNNNTSNEKNSPKEGGISTSTTTTTTSSSSPFGFVGLLTRAMDHNEQRSTDIPPTTHQPSTFYRNNTMGDILSEEDHDDDNNNNGVYHPNNNHSNPHFTRNYTKPSPPPPIEIQSDDENEDEDEIDFAYVPPPLPSTKTIIINHNDTNIRHSNAAIDVPNDLIPSLPSSPPPLLVEASSSTGGAIVPSISVVPQSSPTAAPAVPEEPPMSPYQRRKHLPRDDSMDYEYQPDSVQMRQYIQQQHSTHATSSSIATTNLELSPPTKEPPSQDGGMGQHSPVEPPIRFSLVRESGSVSPQRTSKMMSMGNSSYHWDPPIAPGSNHDVTSALSSNQYTSTNISSRSLGSTPSGKEVLLSPLQNILQSERQEQQQQEEEIMNHDRSTAQQYPRHGDDDDILTTNVDTTGSGGTAKQFPRDALLGSFSVPNDSDDIARLVEETQEHSPPTLLSNHHDNNADENNAISEIPPSTNNTNHYNAKVLHRADSGQLPAAKQRGSSQTRTGRSSLPMISLESFDENDDVDHSNSSVSASRNHSEPTVTEQQIPSGSANTIAHSNEQAEAIQLLELKCQELQSKLTNAESHIVELQTREHASDSNRPNESTNVEYENLMIQFQEKETRLLQAANEEYQNEINNVRYEMNQQILTLQQQLLEERNAFGKERDEMASKLEEYHSTVEKLQLQSRTDQEKNEKAVDQIQQQHIRALRKVEDKLAFTVASLEERDNDTKRYRERIQQLESKLSEQNKGVNEVEEEVNELHNENEILHDHIERLQAEAVELRNTITKLEGDSEKLVHMKVCEIL